MTKTEELWLDNNEIEEIDVRLFKSLSNLKMLNLYHNNKIKRIDSISFKDMTKLEELWLEHNEIEEIDLRLFDSLGL